MQANTRRAGQWVLVAVIALGAAAAAAAAGQDAVQSSTVDKSLHKLGRGITNVLTFPLELIRTPEKVGRTDGALAGASVGILQGAFRAVQRGVVGFYEVVTFYAEVPKDYAPIMQPEFVYANGNWQ
jgi:putative exosortase-associated protein (TIGR04073 family)